ncbi:MAG: hypothetical protein M1817_006584 [Caeruleum heppii]|nr:MAG: hypothetical protein M1817_006584 [Caeruleum heppii]
MLSVASIDPYPTPPGSSWSSTAPLLTDSTARQYVRCGIGGAGNYREASPSSSALAGSSHSIPRKASRQYSSGIGGAGNWHRAATEMATHCHPSDKAHARLRSARTVDKHFIGIGGYGNFKNGRCAVQNVRQSSLATAGTARLTADEARLSPRIPPEQHRRYSLIVHRLFGF